MAEQTKKIAAPCDSRCQYANPDNPDCNCECGGSNHGQGSDVRVWEKKRARLSITRKAFRKSLNAEVPRSGTHLYRHQREEFDKQYLIWKSAQLAQQENETAPEQTTTVPQGSELTVIKDAKIGEDTFSHVRRQNGKTEYRKNDKLITKAQVPTELGW